MAIQNEIVPSPAERLLSNYTGTLYALDSRGFPEFKGIFSPIYTSEYVNRFIHEQFLGGADTYAKHYEKFSFFESLLRKAIKTTRGNDRSLDEVTILDIGSGSGNSIIPLLRIFPSAAIVASDLSPQLLTILREHLIREGESARCALLQLNAEELDFKEQSFDYVVGAAILHHLFHPEKTIKGASKILRDGGAAIFIEPFESGNFVLRMAYHTILDHPRANELEPKVATFLRNRIKFADERRGSDKSDPKYLNFDDKWNFSIGYFQDLADACGFSRCRHFAVANSDTAFETKAKIHLRGKSEKDDPFPEWAWEIIREYDQSISRESRNDLPIEAVVIMTK